MSQFVANPPEYTFIQYDGTNLSDILAIRAGLITLTASSDLWLAQQGGEPYGAPTVTTLGRLAVGTWVGYLPGPLGTVQQWVFASDDGGSPRGYTLA